jgi:hypothetical protein
VRERKRDRGKKRKGIGKRQRSREKFSIGIRDKEEIRKFHECNLKGNEK